MVRGGDDALGILPCEGEDGAEPPAKKAKNVNLKHWELPPQQLLNPMGMSAVGKLELPNMWELLRKGGDHSMYYCNLCSEDPRRRKVGLSQFSEVLEQLCNHLLNDKVLEAVVKPELLKQARAEAQPLLLHFRKLNQGKSIRGGAARLKNAAYYNHDVSRPATEELDEAANVIHSWLSKPESKLRALIAALSAGGLFFVGQCHEKSARAFVHHGGGSSDAMRVAAKAFSNEGVVTGRDDAAGLGTG